MILAKTFDVFSQKIEGFFMMLRVVEILTINIKNLIKILFWRVKRYYNIA